MKFWLTGITNEGNKENLQELIEPIRQYFDGLIWLFHYPKDEGADYLESVKGDGEILYTKWCKRLDFSRNHTLYQGPMKLGDWFVTLDTLERLSPTFASGLRSFVKEFEKNGIDGSYLYNKRFMFKLKEHTAFVGNPHEGIKGATNTIDFTRTDIWEEEFLKNTRASARDDEFYFVKHNFKYYLFAETNNFFLGFESDKELIEKRYETRGKFIGEVSRLGFYPFSIESIKECLENNMTDILKECINFDKFLNDWYRYEILGMRDLVDKHDFSYIKKI